MTNIEIIAIEESTAYKGFSRHSKKYHLARTGSNESRMSICAWAINKNIEAMVGLLKKEQLCKICFNKYLKATEGEKEEKKETSDSIDSRWEILDFGT